MVFVFSMVEVYVARTWVSTLHQMVMKCDNQAPIYVANHQLFHKKILEVDCHINREKVLEEVIQTHM